MNASSAKLASDTIRPRERERTPAIGCRLSLALLIITKTINYMPPLTNGLFLIFCTILLLYLPKRSLLGIPILGLLDAEHFRRVARVELEIFDLEILS